MPHSSIHRRSFLQASLVGSGLASLPGITWPNLQAASSTNRRRSLILLWQDGGPSHFETFDPKPHAPSEYRGELGAIPTTLPGISYCEVLPKLARLADRTAVIRSLHQPSSGHVIGSHNVLTGWNDETDGGTSRYPDLAAVISRMRSGVEDAKISIGASTDARLAQGLKGPGRSKPVANGSALPQYIDIGKGLHRGGPAFLGPVYGPFQVSGDPSKPGFVVQNLESAGSATRLLDRQQMLKQLDRLGVKQAVDVVGWEQLHAVDGFRQQALDLLSGGAAARAFDFTREPTSLRERYGNHLAGQQCLLARRLVEAGAGVVAIRYSPDGRGDYDRSMIGWDDHAVHGNIFEIMRQRGPQFDQSVSALIEDLDQRGLADEVLVVVVGEFGRTPRIHVHKGCPGREHWGPSGCALLFGGGLRMGQVIGQTNDKGERPAERPLTYQDLLATIYHAMGVDSQHTFINHAGRPVPILPSGQPIEELVGSRTEPDTDRSRSGKPTKIRSPIHLADSHGETIALPRGASNADLAAVGNLSQLESLSLEDTRIDDDGLEAIQVCRQLRQLKLNGTQITDAGMAHLAGLKELEDLNLSFTRITSASLQQLKSLTRLRQLSFNGTPITLADISRLFVQQQGRPLTDALLAMGLAVADDEGNLIAVNVAGTSFGDEQLKQLQSAETLKELQIAATQVTDAGMEEVARFPSLQRLFLAKCDVGDSAMQHVSRLNKLESLNIYGTKITSAALAHLASLEKLRILYITDIKLEAAAVDRLKQKLPQLTVTDYTPV
jgi:hypothetical protein